MVRGGRAYVQAQVQAVVQGEAAWERRVGVRARRRGWLSATTMAHVTLNRGTAFG